MPSVSAWNIGSAESQDSASIVVTNPNATRFDAKSAKPSCDSIDSVGFAPQLVESRHEMLGGGGIKLTQSCASAPNSELASATKT